MTADWSEGRPFGWIRPAEDAAGLESLRAEIEELYDAHGACLLRFATGATGDADFASESVQEVFLRYAEMRRRERRPPQPLTWLLRALRQRIAQRCRAQEREVGGRSLPRQRQTDAPSPEELTFLSEARKILERVAAPRERECVLLRAEGLGYEEIAAVMGITSGAVGAMLTRVSRKFVAAIDPIERERSR
jgi:RNA polymerase sigma-70 factor (ECF subfamily)